MIFIYCPCCDKETRLGFIDEGFGTNEYWGAIGNDVQMIPVCSECGEYIDTDISFDQYEYDQRKNGD